MSVRLTLGEGRARTGVGRVNRGRSDRDRPRGRGGRHQLIDTAPMYGACEAVIAATFDGVFRRRSGDDEVSARNASAGTAADEARAVARPRASRRCASIMSTSTSCTANICDDDTVYAHGNDHRASFATPWSQYVEESLPAFRRPEVVAAASARGYHRYRLPEPSRGPAVRREASVVQVVTNVLDFARAASGGFSEAARPRAIIARRTHRGRGHGNPRGAGRAR